MGDAAPGGGTVLPWRRACRKPASAATRRMAKRKRKITEMTEKKNKKLKKASAKEMPPAATPGTGEAHAEGGAAWGAGQDTALELPELTPEEKRVLERKLKKERRKEERKQLRKAAVPSVPAKPSGAQLALDYLRGGTCGEVKSRVPAASPRPRRPQRFSSSGSGVRPAASAASAKTVFPGETQLGHTHLWAQKHENWKFQKTRQTWLLLHMYDNDQVPDELFSTLLAYLEGLRGRARELTVQKAEALMQKSDEARGADTLPLGTIQRVRQVLQLLS
ncbi:uncharacterized protein C7orf50 homolog [Panthera tigris]|uniref:uncharacterized protein C7orf50 homolog n=1 Tax=Panthera tigris TaxID=9694 RepID=UPI001C6FA7FE|nr:uncharacterized protein C7orf50 homolog [Panthera tigris]